MLPELFDEPFELAENEHPTVYAASTSTMNGMTDLRMVRMQPQSLPKANL
jgi:hypothetical protein